jgi:hypothetical protein
VDLDDLDDEATGLENESDVYDDLDDEGRDEFGVRIRPLKER